MENIIVLIQRTRSPVLTDTRLGDRRPTNKLRVYTRRSDQWWRAEYARYPRLVVDGNLWDSAQQPCVILAISKSQSAILLSVARDTGSYLWMSAVLRISGKSWNIPQKFINQRTLWNLLSKAPLRRGIYSILWRGSFAFWRKSSTPAALLPVHRSGRGLTGTCTAVPLNCTTKQEQMARQGGRENEIETAAVVGWSRVICCLCRRILEDAIIWWDSCPSSSLYPTRCIGWVRKNCVRVHKNALLWSGGQGPRQPLRNFKSSSSAETSARIPFSAECISVTSAKCSRWLCVQCNRSSCGELSNWRRWKFACLPLHGAPSTVQIVNFHIHEWSTNPLLQLPVGWCFAIVLPCFIKFVPMLFLHYVLFTVLWDQ